MLHIHSSATSIINYSMPLPDPGTTTAFEEGLLAYTLCQGSVCQHLLDTFTHQWHDKPAFIVLTDQELADEETVEINNTMW